MVQFASYFPSYKWPYCAGLSVGDWNTIVKKLDNFPLTKRYLPKRQLLNLSRVANLLHLTKLIKLHLSLRNLLIKFAGNPVLELMEIYYV